MLETLTRDWWAIALRGLAAVLFGLMALIWPGITLFALVLIFGVYAVVDGAFTLIAALDRRHRGRPDGGSRGWLIAEGIAGIIIGVLAAVWPGITALTVLWMIAAWAVATGVLEIVAAVLLRHELRHEWLLAVNGALSVLFGVLLAVWPAAGALTLVVLIGIAAIVFGVTLLTLGFRLRQRSHTASGTMFHHRSARA
jgi:uncharacterized membrane protein HdeD (DUF308 family)